MEHLVYFFWAIIAVVVILVNYDIIQVTETYFIHGKSTESWNAKQLLEQQIGVGLSLYGTRILSPG